MKSSKAAKIAVAVAAMALVAAKPPGFESPPDVINLQVAEVTHTSITLKWDSGGGTTATYLVAYKEGTEYPPKNLRNSTVIDVGSATSYEVTGLTRDQTYSFRVCAVNTRNKRAAGVTIQGTPVFSSEEFTPLDFSPDFNRRLQDNVWGSIGMPDDILDPSGITFLGNVPFSIPVEGNNYWHSYDPSGEDNSQRTLSITTDILDARAVHTLINTYWGVAGPASFAMVEVFGTGDAYARFDLIGNENVRDFNENPPFTNQITDPTINVATWTEWLDWDASINWQHDNQRLDMQTFVLPESFQGETLTEIRFTDNGGLNFEYEGETYLQRILVAGVTVALWP